MDEGLQRRTLPHQNDLVWHPNIGKIFCEIGPMTTIEAHALIVWFVARLEALICHLRPRNEDIRHKWHRLLKPPRLAGGCLALHSFVKNNCRRTPVSHLKRRYPHLIWPNQRGQDEERHPDDTTSVGPTSFGQTTVYQRQLANLSNKSDSSPTITVKVTLEWMIF